MPVPCTGEDGLIALVMAIAAGISAEERRWVDFSELSTVSSLAAILACTKNMHYPTCGISGALQTQHVDSSARSVRDCI
ncbi:MAG: hypothetical protein SGPRY_013929 [Prymnesium sp.]